MFVWMRRNYLAEVAYASLLVLILQIGPARADMAACPVQSKSMARLELFFGLGSGRGPVSPRAFADFIAREVTPRFPDGLSLFEGYGQWRDQSGRISRESARMLLIWYEPGADSDAKIEMIREAYKRRFKQQSVMRVDETSCVSF